MKEQVKRCQCDSKLFFSICMHNPFVNLELINTTVPEKWSTMYAIFSEKITKFISWYFFHKLSKFRVQVICKFLIYALLICKLTSYLENRRRSYPYNRGTLLAAACPPATFTILITELFLWETRLKSEQALLPHDPYYLTMLLIMKKEV